MKSSFIIFINILGVDIPAIFLSELIEHFNQSFLKNPLLPFPNFVFSLHFSP